MVSIGIDKWLIGAVLSVAALLGSYYTGYWNGWNDSENEWIVKSKDIKQKAELEAAELRAKSETLAAELVVAKAKVRIETVEVVREVTRYVRPKHEAIDGRITTLLNSLSGIRERTERTVHHPDGAFETRTTVATDSDRPVGATSEAGIVNWITQVIPMYNACKLQAEAAGEALKHCAGKVNK